MANEAKGKEPQQKEESATPKKKVTSQMLLNKFQHNQERRQYREESARRHEGCWHSLERQFTYRKRTDHVAFPLEYSPKVYQSTEQVYYYA